MIFAVYAICAVTLITALGIYFSRKLDIAIQVLAPGLTHRPRRFIRILYYTAYFAFPATTLLWVLFALITGNASVRPPQSTLVDYLVVYPFWFVFVWSVQCALFYLLVDVYSYLQRLFTRRSDTRLLAARRFQARVIAAIALVFAVYLPARVAYDNHAINVQHIAYEAADLPAALDGLRIVLISDMQADRYTGAKELSRYVDLVNQQKPNLVLVAGDMITSSPDYIDLAAEYAGRIQAPMGVYTCVGDHDNWAFARDDNERSIRAITEALAAKGVHMLDNQHKLFQVDGQTVSVLFITDNYVTRADDRVLDKLFAESQESDLRIVVTHQPSPNLIERAAKNGIDLFLAGHTHGGQVRMWFPFIDLSLVAFETDYVRGSFQLGDMKLIVSSGLGVSVAPFRYNATPTIEVIDVTRNASSKPGQKVSDLPLATVPH